MGKRARRRAASEAAGAPSGAPAARRVGSAAAPTAVAAAALLAIAAAALGCRADGSDGPPEPKVARSSLARDASPAASDADLAAAAAGTTRFALAAFPLLDADPGANAFFSPYSVVHGFALLAPGARGDTLAELQAVLRFALPLERMNLALDRLDLALAASASGADLGGGRRAPLLSNANAAWAQDGLTVLPAYLDALALYFGAGVYLADFEGAAEAARLRVNAWVEDKTNDRIANLVPPGALDASTRLVLTNALWFKADWAGRFSKDRTASGSFHDRDGTDSPAPFMRDLVRAGYAESAGWKAVDLPYAEEELSMLVIVPDSGTIDAFSASLTPELLASVTDALSPTTVDLSMPKFELSATAPMKAILQSLGMSRAFDASKADFSGIDGALDLFVQSVHHKAWISVDEDGTEAAAATSIGMGVTSAPSAGATLVVDRPFIFMIRHAGTGTILFMGKVVGL